ncbi:hypothetical protein chiPu_0034017, partial [Chiloscyllium punctatum]|nr:hypothetical protein [Chiloscyllium punctatum]
FGERLGPPGVDQKGQLTLVLGTIDRRVRSRIDDEIGLQAFRAGPSPSPASTDRTSRTAAR